MIINIATLFFLAIDFSLPSQIDPGMFVGKWTYDHDYENGINIVGYSHYSENEKYDSEALVSINGSKLNTSHLTGEW